MSKEAREIKARKELAEEMTSALGVTRSDLCRLVGYAGTATTPLCNWEKLSNPSFHSRLESFLSEKVDNKTLASLTSVQKVFPGFKGNAATKANRASSGTTRASTSSSSSSTKSSSSASTASSSTSSLVRRVASLSLSNSHSQDLVNAIEANLKRPLSPEVRQSFLSIDRRLFLPPDLQDRAYEDVVLKSGSFHQSAPHIYALILEELGRVARPGMSFLNIGSGSGYLSSLVGWCLASLSSTNHGVELSQEMVEFSIEAQKKLSIPLSIQFKCGNGLSLVGVEGTYSLVYVGADCQDIATAKSFTKFLSKGGILLAPVGKEFLLFKKTGDPVPCFGCEFAPIVRPSTRDPQISFPSPDISRSDAPTIKGGHGLISLHDEDTVKKKAKSKECDKFLKNEALTLIKLVLDEEPHPNIVQLIELSYENERPILLLEKLELTLDQVWDSLNDHCNSWLTAEQFFLILHDCAQALSFIHSQCMMHLDIKPNNIMLTKDHRAKLIDFGLSRGFPTEQELTKKSLPLVGTATWRDDSRMMTHQYTEEVDIYSMGKVVGFLSTWCPFLRISSSTQKELKDLADECTKMRWQQPPTATQLATIVYSFLQNYPDFDIPLSGVAKALKEVAEIPTAAGAKESDGKEKLDRAELFSKSLVQIAAPQQRTITIASWNLCHLGGSINETKLSAIANTIHQQGIDLLAIQEIFTSDALKPISKQLSSLQGIRWSYSVSPRVGKNFERLGFLWREPVILQSASIPSDPEGLWIRKPYYAKFHVGKSRFLLCTTHLSFSDATLEVNRIGRFIQALEKANHLKRCTRVLLLGDFNLKPESSAWSSFASQGWWHLIPKNSATNLLGDKAYDNIWIQEHHAYSVSKSVVVPPPASSTIKREWSDHRPVVASFRYQEGSEFITSELRAMSV